jgi:glycosyltransferase involved in cell wall biosynthesis
VRISILSSHNEACGIATYSSQLQQALEHHGHEVSIHKIDNDRLRRCARSELSMHFDGFVKNIDRFDAFILQHEFGLYAVEFGMNVSNRLFSGLVTALARWDKPTVVVFHSPPPPSTFRGVVRQERCNTDSIGRRDAAQMLGAIAFNVVRAIIVRPSWRAILKAINDSPRTVAVVHTCEARRLMIGSGLYSSKLNIIRHGVPKLEESLTLRQEGPANDNGVTRLAIFGFIAAYKGYEIALRALLELPANFKLIIAGGPHPADVNERTLQSILTFIATGDYPSGILRPLSPRVRTSVRERLSGRVEITGYLQQDDIRALLGRTSLVLAPYLSSGPLSSGAVTWGLVARRPIVASRIPGFAELNEVEPCMLLVDPGSPTKLARAIMSVCSSSKLESGLVAAAERYAMAHAWPNAARQFSDCLVGLQNAAL